MTEEKKLTWLELMWKNFYIQLFVVAIAFLIVVVYYELFSDEPFYSLTGFIIGLTIPIGMMIMIGYFAFYKFWKEYNNKK